MAVNTRFISVVSVVLVAAICSASPIDISVFVSTTGNDKSGTGTSSNPFATVGAAQQKVRNLLKSLKPDDQGIITVYIQHGTYTMGDAPLQFEGPHDSGTANVQIKYMGVGLGDNVPILSAGVHVPPSAFKPCTAGSSVMCASLAKLGMTDLGDLTSGGLKDCQNNKAELFFQNNPMTLARWPNKLSNGSNAWAHVAKPIAGGFVYDSSEGCPAAEHKWDQEKDLWVHGYWEQDWSDEYEKIASVNAATNTLMFNRNTSVSSKVGGRWYALNLLSELDQKEEYYIDRELGMLYFIPNDASNLEGAYISNLQHVLVATNLQYVTFENIVFSHSRGTGAVAIATQDVVFNNCTFSNLGGNGTNVVGMNSGVVLSHVYGVGCMGISVIGGIHETLLPGNNFVLGCNVHHYARWKRTYQPGVFWAGVGNTYSSNTISWGPHNAFLGGGNEADCYNGKFMQICGGNDNVFEHNTISDVAYECDDTGAFYTCGQDSTAWINRGNVLRNNTFIRIRMTEKTELGFPSVQAIYLDDQMSGWTVEGNTIIDSQVGMLLGGGRDNIVRGNSFQNCDTGIHFDNRGMGWQKSSIEALVNVTEEASSFPAWKKYDIQLEHPGVPVNNTIEGNDFCKCKVEIDASMAEIKSWNSSAINNHNSTAC
eukprot:m.120145 g.120145  ORF g.120145 m.120145 type:complete len:652 (+) comp14348_c0_seq2:16-1971(+)